jgi:hypothetical protein
MAYGQDSDNVLRLRDFVKDAIVADADAVRVAGAG